MPFSPTYVSASFQRALYIILTSYKWKMGLVCFGDIIIFLNSIKAHIDHVDNILYSLEDAVVTLKVKQCKFFTNKFEYLGHIIRPEKL